MKNLVAIVALIILSFVLILLSSVPTELTYDIAERLDGHKVEFASATNPAWKEGVMKKSTEENPTTHSPTENIVKWGSFKAKRMSANGRAVVYKNLNDLYIALEFFKVSHYPDLKLYLIPLEDTNSATKVQEAFYEVGMVHYEGDQMFDLPDDLDIGRYKAAVIFSEKQNMIYALASLR